MRLIKLVPNIITMGRLVGVAVAAYLLFQNNYKEAYLSFFIFYAVAVLDSVDGYVARKFDAVTVFGKIMDPVVDKILILTVFLSFAILGHISHLWIWPIILRELLVTVARMILLKRGIVIEAEKSGKTKVFLQYISSSFLFLLYFNTNYWKAGIKSLDIILTICSYSFLILALYFTISSGIDFFRKNWTSISRKSQ